jgi:hypothetical protein
VHKKTYCIEEPPDFVDVFPHLRGLGRKGGEGGGPYFFTKSS